MNKIRTNNRLISAWKDRTKWGYFLVLLSTNAIDGVFGSTSIFNEFFPSKYLIIILFVFQFVMILLSAYYWGKGEFLLVKLTVFSSLFIETILMVSMNILLMKSLSSPHSPVKALRLLLESIIIWFVNIWLFSLWYWFIDGNGSETRKMMANNKNKWERDCGNNKTRGVDFWFPQQSQNIPGWKDWLPSYPDYFFLAFSTSTAFSPTDTLVLSWRAKLLMLIQALNSLIALTVVAARAINSLQ